MNDVLPDEVGAGSASRRRSPRTMSLHGFREVRTPLVEPTALFVRAIGEATDVVEKEMYSFEHHDEALTLRPEGTAGAARAYVEHGVHSKEPVTRWWYAGPMFRAERPQRGRYRQFYQLGAEIFGDPGPGCDAEMIDMLVGFSASCRGARASRCCVNSLGGAETRERYRQALVAVPHAQGGRALRGLAAAARDQPAPHPRLRRTSATGPPSRGAPTLHDAASSDDDRAHFDGLRRHLDALGTPYARRAQARARPRLLHAHALRDQRRARRSSARASTLVGGGRYDGMIAELGGPQVPAIGFAAGLERLLIASELQVPAARSSTRSSRRSGRPRSPTALVLARDLRRSGHPLRGRHARRARSRAQLRRANALGARVVLILGESELAERVVQVKDLDAHTQERLPRDTAVAHRRRSPRWRLRAASTRSPGRGRREGRGARAGLARARPRSLSTAASAWAQGMRGGAPGAAAPGTPRSRPGTATARAGPREEGRRRSTTTRYQVMQRSEPEIARRRPDPLAVSPEVAGPHRQRLGERVPRRRADAPLRKRARAAVRASSRYHEQRGDYRFRIAPPFLFEQRAWRQRPGRRRSTASRGTEDHRGPLRPALLPAALAARSTWTSSSRRSGACATGRHHVVVVGPLVHREAPGENDNWLAPLFFSGAPPGRRLLPLARAPDDLALGRQGRVHARRPVLPQPHAGPTWTWASRRSSSTATTATSTATAGPTRSSRRSSSITREHELDVEQDDRRRAPSSPQTNPKRSVFDVAPFYFHIVGQARDRRRRRGAHDALSVLPLRLHARPVALRVARLLPARDARRRHACHASLLARDDADGATSSRPRGPVVPFAGTTATTTSASRVRRRAVLLHVRQPDRARLADAARRPLRDVRLLEDDVDLPEPHLHDHEGELGAAFTRSSTSGADDGHVPHRRRADLLGLREPGARARPSASRSSGGSPTHRTTRSSRSRPTRSTSRSGSPAGPTGSFTSLPLFSYGENPQGYFWNVLFGLAGYERDGAIARAKAFWVPFQVDGPKAAVSTGGGSRSY